MPEPRIWILPTEVAERIAAGEVVERPASVVKELVENALDAGAHRVTVETESGGKVLIRVTDDGCGMTAEEAAIALQRHATSKIRSADDLFNIHTLGFRGEALPSIAAVSELEILSRTPDSTEGTRILIVGGVIRSQAPAAAQIGTSFTVRRLFFNVPVREKFLRGDATEAAQITDWLQRLALSRPDVSFRLVHDGREALLSAGSQEPLNSVVAVLGRGIARDLLRVGDPAVPRSVTGLGETDAMRVTGFVGRPTLTRANRALQHFYVNGRSVRSPLFYKALDNAFRSTMPHGRHPVALLFIDVPPGAVDVNVHPAKTEVRFQDEGAIHEAVLRAVQEALRTDPAQGANPVLPGTSRASRVEEPAAFAPEAPPAGTPLPFADSAIGGPSPQERYRTWSRGAPGAGGPEEVDPFEHLPSGRSETSGGRPSWSPGTPARTPFPEPSPDTSPGYRWSAPAPSEPEPTPRSEAIPPAELARQPEPAIPELRLLGQSQDLFILAEGGGRLWIIDQHVAHERVLFDRMTSEGARRDPSEALLIPATLEVDRAQALALEEHRALLGDLGFEVEPFGRSRYVLRSVPRTLLGRNYEAVFRDLADELTERTQGGQVKLRRDEVALAAAGRSCKSAVKAGQKLGTTEVVRLLEDLRHARHPHTCPHGRPVFLTLDEDEVAQLFGGRDCD